MNGFDIWYDNTCIHSEKGFDIDNTQDLYDDVLSWWNNIGDNTYDAKDVIVKLFCDDEEEELTMADLL